MDKDTIARENLIERYVAGKLSPEEEAEFEEYFLDDEECIEQIEAAERLQRGLRDVAQEEHVKTLKRGFLISLLASTRVRAGLLASVLLAIVALPFLWQQQRVDRLRDDLVATQQELDAARGGDSEQIAGIRRELDDARQALSAVESRWGAVVDAANEEKERLAARLAAALAPRGNARIVSLSPFRDIGIGEAPRHRIDRPTGDAWLVISLDVPDPDVTAYRAVLRQGDEVLWRSGDLVPDEIGSVVVSFPPGFLDIGDYWLDLVEVDDGQRVARYPLDVREADTSGL